MNSQELWVNRAALRECTVHTRTLPDLKPGEIRVRIDKFALTANNISYAISGDMIGYWKYYPAAEQWGIVPVWGFADVIDSKADEIPVGERLWGFFPMATHATLTPGEVSARQFNDQTEHRRTLPALYNNYQRTSQDGPEMKAFEDARCVLFPLFATSFVLYDYLVAHEFFGADDILIGSASSKTGYGLAHLLHHDKQAARRVIGLTSPGNIPFTKDLGLYDASVPYADIPTLDATRKVALIDMSGSAPMVTALHRHYGANVVESCMVGATHWEADRHRPDLPGAKPTFFFAPAHIARRDQEWGKGAVARKAMEAAGRIVADMAGKLKIVHKQGPDQVRQSYLDMLDNKIAPSLGLMLSMKS